MVWLLIALTIGRQGDDHSAFGPIDDWVSGSTISLLLRPFPNSPVRS